MKKCVEPSGASSSLIESTKVEKNGVTHSVLMTHVCALDADKHETVTRGDAVLTMCVCECGHRWARNFK